MVFFVHSMIVNQLQCKERKMGKFFNTSLLFLTLFSGIFARETNETLLTPVVFINIPLLPCTSKSISPKNTNTHKVLLKALVDKTEVAFFHETLRDNRLYGVLGTVRKEEPDASFIVELSSIVQCPSPFDRLVSAASQYYVRPHHIKKIFLTEETAEETEAFRSQIILPLVGDRLPATTVENIKRATHSNQILTHVITTLNITLTGHQILDLLMCNNLNERIILATNILTTQLTEPQETLLGEPGTHFTPGSPEEMKYFRDKAHTLSLSKDALQEVIQAIDQLEMAPSDPIEAPRLRSFITFFLALPWNSSSTDTMDMKAIEQALATNHFGMTDVKERILDHIALRIMNPQSKSSIICLVGPPGTGKTAICKVIADALNKKFARIALGGVHDEPTIRGHRRTYVGALPGKIIDTMKKVGVKNPLIALDEIDKVATGNQWNGNPADALLEVLDPEQSHNFQDHYVGVGFDLSQVFFITTANDLSTISRPLLDRMEIIEVSGYTTEEKLQITRKHLLPPLLKEIGLSTDVFELSDTTIRSIIENYTFESGVRQLKTKLRILIAKHVRAHLKKETIVFSPETLASHLGMAIPNMDMKHQHPTVGIAHGLHVHAAGGGISVVEAALTPGRGRLNLTGRLSTVTQESAQIAFRYAQAHAAQLGIPKELFSNFDVHIHMPRGSIPKDGASAGVTLLSAMVSLFTNQPIDNTYAMTGELSLHGTVIPIGGVKEKLLAAYKAGFSHVIFPEDNRRNVEEIDALPTGLNIVYVTNADEVLAHVLCDP